MLCLVGEVTQELSLTTLLVSHLPQEASLIGGRIILIEEGKVAAHEPVSVLTQSPIHSDFAHYFGVYK